MIKMNDMQNAKVIKGIVFADLDNTLLDDKVGKIPESALCARKKLKENGYLLTLATGRDMDTHYSRRYAAEIEPDAIINCNGSKIMADGRIISLHYMDDELVKRLYEFCLKNNICIGVSIGEYDYFVHPEVKSIAELTYKSKLERNYVPFEDLIKNKLKVFNMSYAGDVKKDKPILEKAFPEIQLFAFAKGVGADVVERGHSKADGVDMLTKYYDVDQKDTYAIGDSANDVPMLKKVNTSIAMGNADKIAKEVASYITDRVDNDGFYKAMAHFGLI